MKVIYIAGPYRADCGYKIDENIRRAREAAAEVWECGAAALCPHLNSAHMDGMIEDREFLRGGLAMLERCDAVFVHDTTYSEGTELEVLHAHRKRIPVFYSLTELAEWISK